MITVSNKKKTSNSLSVYRRLPYNTCKKNIIIPLLDRVKLIKCDKDEWNEKCHYASNILFK